MIKNKILKLFLLLTLFVNAQNYREDWEMVKYFEKNNQPKKVLEVVNKIYNGTKQKSDTQFIKSLLYKEKYSYLLEKDFAKNIKDVEREIDNSKNVTTQLILKSILAQMYKEFLEYRQLNGTNLYIDEKEDIYSWSLKKIESKISTLYLESLQDAAKKVAISKYQDILTEEQNSRGLRPTLYDFLAFRALDYFNYQYPYSHLYLDRKELFSSIDHFLKLDLHRDKTTLFKYRSIDIYKKLLQFHKDDKNSRALEYVNLERLQFVYRNFINLNRDKYYLDALNSLDSQNGTIQVLYLAQYYFKKTLYSKAISYAKKGIKSKNHYIASKCRDIKNRIEEKSLSIAIEDINLPNENILSKISYKNIDKVYLKVVKISPEERRTINHIYGKMRDKYINTLTPIVHKSISLIKDDYKEHSSEVSLGSYPLGEYLFVLSSDKDFNKNISYTISSVSKLAYFHKNSKILIVDRVYGIPLKDVNVTFYNYFYNKKSQKEDKRVEAVVKSDNSGLVEIPKNMKSYSMKLEYGDDVLYFEYDRYYKRDRCKIGNKSKEVLYIFTDKSIYRPSQRILFKGLLVKQFTNRKPQIVTSKKLKVVLNGANGKVLKSKIFKTDEFGSFYGFFTIPKEIKSKNLYISSNIFGGTSIKVEEYKKPQIIVDFNTIRKDYKLSDIVTVKGVVKSSTGYKLSGLKVRYTINEIALFPWINEWDKKQLNQEEAKVSMRELLTDEHGRFKIDFTAMPISNIPKAKKPLFRYRVDIDIIDSQGESHSYRKIVNVGTVAVNVNMIIDSTLDRNQANFIQLDSRDLYGDFKEVSGKITIYRLKPKDKIYRKRYWSRVDRAIYTKKEFIELFKSYEYDESIDSREKTKIKTINFNTKKSNKILLDHLKEGEYIFTLSIEDRYGVRAKKSKKITLYDTNKNTPPHKMALWQKTDKDTYSIGSTAIIDIKTSIPNSMLFFSICKGNKVVKERWIDIKDTIKERVPLTQDDSGDLFYSIIMVKDGRDYSQHGVIKVPWKNRLKVEYVSFKDILKPDSKEEWKIKISRLNREDEKVQMVATLYDASIDKLIKNDFRIKNLYPKHKILYYNKWSGEHFFYREYRDIYQAKIDNLERKFHRLNWFGFTINNSFIRQLHLYTSYSNSDMLNEIYHEKIDNREDFADTIFFKPILESNQNGEIIIDFKTNKSLKHWSFLGFIHTKDLKTAVTSREILTQKEIMVEANLPNFFRADDRIVLSQKVTNLSGKDINGTLEVKLLDDMNKSIDRNLTKSFRIKKGSSIIIDFKVKIPKVYITSTVRYRAVAKTKEFIDINEKTIPIVLNGVLATESLPLYIQAKYSKSITLKPFKEGNLTNIQNYRLGVEFTTNPALYAIKAMPSIMRYSYNSIDSIFNKYFVNAILSKLIQTSPKIENILNRVFNTQEVVINRDKMYKILIDRQQQHFNGGWSWFKGGSSNLYITEYIVEWFGKLKKLGIDKTDTEMLGVATAYMDKQIASRYQTLKSKVKSLNSDHLDGDAIYYLYARSFYRFPILDVAQEAYRYYFNQAIRYWSRKDIYQQAMIALTLNRKLGKNKAREIAHSIKKRVIIDKKIGAYFQYIKNNRISNIEQHTIIMELFNEIIQDKKILELMKIWLLSGKKIDSWQTPKATISAIYTLLANNAWVMNKNRLVDVKFDNRVIDGLLLKTAKQESIKKIGYLGISFINLTKNISTMRVTNPNSSVAWGSIYWQYFKNVTDISRFKGLPISIKKRILPINRDNINIGDKIEVTIDIKVQQDMEFILLKDEIASALVPIHLINTIVQNDRIEYYKSITDDGVYFFFEKLPKGIYRFKYLLFAKQKGKFNSGMTSIKSIFSSKYYSYIKGGQLIID